MKLLKATFLIVLTGVLAIMGLWVSKISSPPPPTSFTTNIWSIVQDQVPRKDLVVMEERVVETIREQWRATPPLWRIPFGDWPGEAIVRIEAPATILWSVPLDSDWSYAIEGSELVIRPPDLQLLSIDVDSAGVQCVYEKTAARWDEHEIEAKIRANMRSRISANALHRQDSIRLLAEDSIIEFFDQYVLRKTPDLDPTLPRRVVWDRDRRQLSSVDGH